MPTNLKPSFFHWLAAALGGVALSVLCVFAIMALRQPKFVFQENSTTPYSAQETHAAWLAYVQTHVATITPVTRTSDIASVQAGLLAMKVTPQDKDAQLALVIGLMALARGDTNAMTRLQSITSALR